MTVKEHTKTDQKLESIFGIKSFSRVKKDLATSRGQFSRGEYKEAGTVLKELRAKYGI